MVIVAFLVLALIARKLGCSGAGDCKPQANFSKRLYFNIKNPAPPQKWDKCVNLPDILAARRPKHYS